MFSTVAVNSNHYKNYLILVKTFTQLFRTCMIRLDLAVSLFLEKKNMTNKLEQILLEPNTNMIAINFTYQTFIALI